MGNSYAVQAGGEPVTKKGLEFLEILFQEVIFVK